MELTPHQAKYFALELTRRTASDDMQKLVPSLMVARVDLNPHQVEAALFAFNYRDLQIFVNRYNYFLR